MTLPTELYHYSSKEVIKLVPEFYDNEYKKRGSVLWGMKPVGFWISVEEEDGDTTWSDWCESEGFRIENLEFKHKVTLDPSAKVLLLKTPEEIREFSVQYAVDEPFDFGERDSSEEPSVYKINWVKIANEYDGIIISPYQRDCRFDSITQWYYTWDCASGCIWNLDIITLKLHSQLHAPTPKEE